VYRIIFTPSADKDVAWFRKPEQRMITSAIVEQLSHEPLSTTTNRKPLRPNPIARWAIRISEYRVFYDVDLQEQVVTIRAVGYKDHNDLFIRGVKVEI
jgi:mRNA-degrading endonuclease RelE of RelBE toxin-antitoxin system